MMSGTHIGGGGGGRPSKDDIDKMDDWSVWWLSAVAETRHEDDDFGIKVAFQCEFFLLEARFHKLAFTLTVDIS